MNELQQDSSFYAIIMLFAGIGIPIMAALNAGLGSKLESPALASTILFLVGTIVSISYLLIFEGIPATIRSDSTPFYYYLGGIFVVFYVLSIAWVAPQFGIGNAVAFVLLGQLVSMATIDQFGLMGAAQTTLTLQRILGLLLMAAGVFLVVRK